MMLEHNTPIEISNPTVRSYWIQYYRSVCRIVSRIPIGFLSDHRILGRFRSVLYRIPSDPISDWITWVGTHSNWGLLFQLLSIRFQHRPISLKRSPSLSSNNVSFAWLKSSPQISQFLEWQFAVLILLFHLQCSTALNHHVYRILLFQLNSFEHAWSIIQSVSSMATFLSVRSSS